MVFSASAASIGFRSRVPGFPGQPGPAWASLGFPFPRHSGDSKSLTELMCFAWDSYKHGPKAQERLVAGGPNPEPGFRMVKPSKSMHHM